MGRTGRSAPCTHRLGAWMWGGRRSARGGKGQLLLWLGGVCLCSAPCSGSSPLEKRLAHVCSHTAWEGLLGPGGTWRGVVGGSYCLEKRQLYVPFLKPHLKADVSAGACFR